MKILFICKYNRFRSKIAETIFNSLNKNNKAYSAGLLKDSLRPYTEKNIIEIMKQKGYNLKGKPKQLTKNLVKNFDLIILVANNINKEFFSNFKGKIIRWNIPDCSANETNKIKKIINKIEDKTKILNNKL